MHIVLSRVSVTYAHWKDFHLVQGTNYVHEGKSMLSTCLCKECDTFSSIFQDDLLMFELALTNDKSISS